jgi:CRISPR system Cascade subunit CasC
LDTFLRAAVLAVPQARKNSMFGHNPPAYVLGLKREGQPLSLVNAFESPVRGNGGYVQASIGVLEEHWETLKNLYGFTATEVTLPPKTLDDLVSGLEKQEA